MAPGTFLFFVLFSILFFFYIYKKKQKQKGCKLLKSTNNLDAWTPTGQLAFPPEGSRPSTRVARDLQLLRASFLPSFFHWSFCVCSLMKSFWIGQKGISVGSWAFWGFGIYDLPPSRLGGVYDIHGHSNTHRTSAEPTLYTLVQTRKRRFSLPRSAGLTAIYES